MSEEPSDARLEEMHILLADDNPLARGVIKSFLRRHGVEAPWIIKPYD